MGETSQDQKSSRDGFGLNVHNFTGEVEDVPVYFQIVRFPSQMLIWIGMSTPKMANLSLATPTRLDPMPATTTLLPGPGGETSHSLAQKLSKKLGISVALSLNIPTNNNNTPSTLAYIERRLVQELDTLLLLPSKIESVSL